MERLTRVYEKSLVKWAKTRPEVLVLSGDLTNSTEIGAFKDAYPDRFISMGLSEQDMMSWSAGLAKEGFVPFQHTFAVFMYRRAFDQLALSVACHNRKARMVGFLPGVTTTGGASHQAIEDIAVVRSLPNMTVLEMGDATEVEGVLDAIEHIDGPVYLHMIRGDIPRLFDPSEPFQIGKARTIQEGDDVLVVSSGLATEQAMYAVKALSDKGASIGHIHVSSFKPFDSETIANAAKRTKRVITMENHVTIGGLGTCVAEALAEHGVGAKVHKLGIQDRFAHGSSTPYLMRKYGIDSRALAAKVEEVLGKDFRIEKESLAPQDFVPYTPPETQLEAL